MSVTINRYKISLVAWNVCKNVPPLKWVMGRDLPTPSKLRWNVTLEMKAHGHSPPCFIFDPEENSLSSPTPPPPNTTVILYHSSRNQEIDPTSLTFHILHSWSRQTPFSGKLVFTNNSFSIRLSAKTQYTVRLFCCCCCFYCCFTPYLFILLQKYSSYPPVT